MTGIPANLLNTITTGDARELARALPDGSVDLIFTDPIYSERPLYDWLATEAQRLLKPGGAVLVWSNGKWHRENANWLEAGGLRYRRDFACVISNASAPMEGKVIAKTNRLIWFEGQTKSRMLDYLPDGYLSVGGAVLGGVAKPTTSSAAIAGGSWGKPTIFTAHALQAFGCNDALVFDPFCGGGTVPAVCKMLNRTYVAFEIDAATAERAR